VRRALFVVLAALATLLSTAPFTGGTPSAASTSWTEYAVADSYTRYDAPSANFGTAPRTSTSATSGHWRHALLKFDVDAPPDGEHISSAKLRLFSRSSSVGAGPDAYTASNDWTETEVTWQTEPEHGRWLGRRPGYVEGTWVNWDVTGVVPSQGGATLSFKLETNEPGWLGFNSRENVHPPRLVLTTASDDAGTPDPSPSPSPTPSPSPSPGPSPGPSTDVVLGAVGDTNPSRNASRSSASAATAASISAADLTAWTHLGDHQYTYGDCSSLVDYFDASGWAANQAKQIDVAGPTHDWSSSADTANYRDHLAGSCPGQTSGRSLADSLTGQTLGPDANYAVDLGAWRVVVLSSGLWRYDVAKAVAATKWLDGALADAAAAGDHVVVAWHEPYWTSTTDEHGPATAVKPWIDVLDRYDVPLLLSGHQHGYARFYPQTADGTRDDATGTQAFIVGTGGIGFYPWLSTADNVATQQTGTYGWLRLVLHANGHYDWEFVRTSGGSYTDSGSR
jgi:acid phosphatase type 7